MKQLESDGNLHDFCSYLILSTVKSVAPLPTESGTPEVRPGRTSKLRRTLIYISAAAAAVLGKS